MSPYPENPLDPVPGLPPELAALDAELASLRMAERPSFAPELEGELRREALRPRPPRRGTARPALAAAVVALLLVGVTVPPARASLVRAGTSLVRLLEPPAPDPAPSAEPATTAEPAAEVAAEAGVAAAGAPDGAPLPPSGAAAAAAAPPSSEPFRPPVVTLPEMVDEEADSRLMRRHYPPRLQEAGIGGTVNLLLWVDSSGAVDHVQIRQGSGIEALDRAALTAAPQLRFRPATHSGRRVGTWVEFPLTFEVTAPSPPALPAPVDLPDVPDRRPSVPPEWTGEAIVPAPIAMEAKELLRTALGDHPAMEARFGTLDGLLEGEPPRGASPLAWRDDAADALERSMVRDPDNPAPYLALARIRRKQGLRTDARVLFERGIQRARRAGDRVSPQLVAELSYELGLVLEEEWMQAEAPGALDPDALGAASCPRAGDPMRSGEAAVGQALVAWSTLCPEELDHLLAEGWRAPAGAEPALARMRASFEAAVDADPAHVGANVELLLDLAHQEHWFDLLNGARRFAWATRGHPYALLLSGLALQRLGRAEEAADDLRRGLEGLPPEEADRIADPRVLMDARAAAQYSATEGADRQRATRGFWAPLDPVLATEVNERFVEHLVRGAHALLRFGGAGTDPGEVWVRYGRPDAVRVLGEGMGVRTEFWDYGRGPDVTFRRSPANGTPDLTGEARAYLDDLRSVLPHRYAAGAGSVFTLPAQVARFRTTHGLELEIHARVPDVLATRASDTLELGLYQLGPGGERVTVDRRRIAARESELRFKARAAPGASQVAVELYHPELRQAVSLRAPIAVAGDPRGSDLLLTAPAAPATRDVHRALEWVSPSARGDLLEGDAAGLLFELYDLDPDAPPYALRVELEPQGGGEVLTVPFRPAGQTLFGDRWSRRPYPGPAHGTEYVTLDLRGVPAGAFDLRVRVDLGSGGELLLERAVERR